MNAERTILIVGASGRAAAESAVRAGWRPLVIDLFADEDTLRCCEVLKCPLDEFPHGFVALARRAPPGPWMYTGGLENFPEVVEAITRSRTLFGVHPEVLKRARDPFALAELVPMPAMRKAGEPLDPAKRWLRKPLRGSGGFGIEELPLAGRASDGSDADAGPSNPRTFPPFAPSLARPANGNDPDGFYAQQWLDGPPRSALFLFPHSGPPDPLGVCAQLSGEAWLNAPPFRYCGNIGPLPIDSALTAELLGIAAALRPLGMRGLIGIDFIRTADGIRVLEVNPRYTASVELYERSLGRSLLAEHIGCFGTPPPKALAGSVRGDRKIHGKAILYAERPFEAPVDHPWRGPRFADIPPVGSIVAAGRPVVSLFASGDTESECRERLMELARTSAPP